MNEGRGHRVVISDTVFRSSIGTILTNPQETKDQFDFYTLNITSNKGRTKHIKYLLYLKDI